ncbi:kynurenine--oxoglutarate transaminase 1 isoform X2 [Rhea pennata]|uniref:kynurenine--oxoglutarate transaminase 1 isoform X2 n=1 Tax=Rhea pennata TaxID=8795 RepID=UPI002E26C2F9
MLRRAGPSLRHVLLERTNGVGHSLHFSEAKMSRPVQARRLEGLDKNIWVEFVKLATTYATVNLGQGFPDFPPPDFLREAFVRAVSGENHALHQYTRAFGHPPLVEILAQFFGKLLGRELDPLTNVMVTVGAYQALFCCFQALVDEGDEVIIIEPFFDCYEPMVKMAGGTPVFVPLRPKAPKAGQLMSSADWQLDPAELASKFGERTKAIVLNSPNNPLGKVFSRGELELIAELCVKHDALCISDEVYEWLVYDGKEHIRMPPCRECGTAPSASAAPGKPSAPRDGRWAGSWGRQGCCGTCAPCTRTACTTAPRPPSASPPAGGRGGGFPQGARAPRASGRLLRPPGAGAAGEERPAGAEPGRRGHDAHRARGHLLLGRGHLRLRVRRPRRPRLRGALRLQVRQVDGQEQGPRRHPALRFLLRAPQERLQPLHPLLLRQGSFPTCFSLPRGCRPCSGGGRARIIPNASRLWCPGMKTSYLCKRRRQRGEGELAGSH